MVRGLRHARKPRGDGGKGLVLAVVALDSAH